MLFPLESLIGGVSLYLSEPGQETKVIQGKETELYVCLKKAIYCFQKAKEDIHQHSLSTASKINYKSKGQALIFAA